MSFGLSGGFEAMQFGRTETMRPGEAVVVTAGAPGHVRASSGGRTITLCLPRAAAAHAVSALDAALCRRIPADNAALRLLTHYVGILDQTDMLATDAQRHAVAHVHDLVALTLGATRDGAEAAKARGAGAARLQRHQGRHRQEPRARSLVRHDRGAPSPAGTLRAAPVRGRRRDVHRVRARGASRLRAPHAARSAARTM